ncbi:hypothetical protein AVEN_61411-1, partial [Araneus ventricosus]
ENTEWKFMPPKSPNFSGLWEAGVKSFTHLKRCWECSSDSGRISHNNFRD